jgi:hypothetical protein
VVDTDQGAELHRFPRTISFKNWPFLALIMIIAALASVPMAIDGNWTMVAFIVAMTMIFPAFFALMQLGAEFIRRPVEAVHEHGLVWRQLWRRGFVPWRDVATIEVTEREVQGVNHVIWEVRTRYRGMGVLVLLDGVGAPEAAEVIEARLAEQK